MLQVQILSPNSIEVKKKGLHRNTDGLCPRNRVENKNKKDLHPNLVRYLAGIWDLFVLTATFLSDHPDPYPQWRER